MSFSFYGMKNLILCSVGDFPPDWIGQVREDVCLIYYGEDTAVASRLKNQCAYFLWNRDFKMPNYVKALEDFGFLENYDQFIFLDDDLIVDPQVFSTCFERLVLYDVDVCQPSVVKAQSSRWAPVVEKREEVFAKYTNFIDIHLNYLH